LRVQYELTMFESKYDSAFAFAVLVFAPPYSDKDIDDYETRIQQLDRFVAGRERSALILVMEKGYPLPDARMRKRFVEARRNIQSRPVVAIVSEHPLLRLVVTAAHWISPLPFPHQVCSTVPEAIAWIESQRGPTLRVLDRLYEEAVASLRARATRSGGASSA
jgi:hypothetical protein